MGSHEPPSAASQRRASCKPFRLRGCALAVLSIVLMSCGSDAQSATTKDPVVAARRLATDLGVQLDKSTSVFAIAQSQSTSNPWYPFNEAQGKTSLQTLQGDNFSVSLSYWAGTLWTNVQSASPDGGYCLRVAETPGTPLAWWAKARGEAAGKLSTESECDAASK